MSATQYLKSLLGLGTERAQPGVEELRDMLAEREAELTLTAEYGRPHPNTTDEPTVVFPYTLYTGAGEQYGGGAKEFVIPDDGLADPDAPLTKFIGKRHGISPDDVDFEALLAVEGTDADAELNEEGDVVITTGPASVEDGGDE